MRQILLENVHLLGAEMVSLNLQVVIMEMNNVMSDDIAQMVQNVPSQKENIVLMVVNVINVQKLLDVTIYVTSLHQFIHDN
jgi:hypothetical protein